ncbi:MAG: Response regulators consisting of a CheY-like receiver domain and a winged-helix DNA-binding domain [Rhodobacteraceae bacterium HLUCCA12]|nr:MAG: Response regulators consisting of a CheY-like receiver domain and a winged-helix DNA-binding domain [Rhodobacteraceae bacterium HLUCCA12]
MPDNTTSVSDLTRAGSRAIVIGLAAIVAILGLAAFLLFQNLPDTNAFNARVERLFAENTNLTEQAELRLLEILAQSGTTFTEVLVSYRAVIFVLMVFASLLLVTALVLVLALIALNRRLAQVQKAGIQVSSLIISRAERKVYLNDMEFNLTEAAVETLAALAEARMDGEMLTGARLESVITGRREPDCDEAAGATRIKRLRDSLGNQIVSELLVRNIARQGYMLTIDKDVIRMI